VSQSGALTASEAKRAELSLVLEFGQAFAEGRVRFLSAEGRVRYLFAEATKTQKCTAHVT
jgi:hypothetical protein